MRLPKIIKQHRSSWVLQPRFAWFANSSPGAALRRREPAPAPLLPSARVGSFPMGWIFVFVVVVFRFGFVYLLLFSSPPRPRRKHHEATPGSGAAEG